ncbi:MFS transporter [Sphingopyxis indica]|uniref:MFS transporter n=1 Tax=Sphingopyxis indica TaxID=436663 RepID=UPI00293938B9|nr:MFS transporter [Sphingopyxis indica]
MSIVLEPIKRDLHLSDSSMGFLVGISFALFYATLGIPIARLADRGNRRTLLAVCLAIWSGFTALSGLAQNFIQLALVRMGVGVGEAGCNPAAHSMLADLFPRERRATAMGIYSLGVPAGLFLGLVVGGYLNQSFGWRVTRLCCKNREA